MAKVAGGEAARPMVAHGGRRGCELEARGQQSLVRRCV
jgi:hypothetical protein